MDKQYYFFLWVKSDCSFCVEAEQELNNNDCRYTVYVMDNDAEALQAIKDEFDWQTVPLVLVQCSDGERKFIGGCSDLKQYLKVINDG